MIVGILPVFGIFILMIFIFRYFLWATIVIPLEELANKSLRLADNDLTVTIPQGYKNTELEKLYRAFNTFVEFFKEKRNNEKKLSLILENITDVLVVTDISGKIQSANFAIEKVFGYNPSEVIGMDMDMLTSPKLFSGNPDDFVGIKYVNDKYELKGIKKTGEIFYIEVDLNEIQHNDEDFFILLISDITEQKEVERMKNEFVSIVSHELRTPLTSIRGSLGLLLSEAFPEVEGKVEKLINIAHNNSLRLIDLINDILDIEKIAAGKMEFKYEQINVQEIIEQIISINAPYADKFKVKYKFVNNLPKDTVLNLDKNRFIQVLTNLLSNATKFSPEGGEVLVLANINKNIVRISVKDNGNGIPEVFRDKIFSKFTQADSSDTRQKGGTGLGLNICKSLVEEMNGNISFETESDKGTVFHIDFTKDIKDNTEI